MEARPKRRPRHTTIELWRIVVLVAGALFFALFAFGRSPSREIHEAVLLSLRAVDTDHASLQRDVLRARAGSLHMYQSLTETMDNLNRTLADLQQQITASGFDTPTGLLDQLSMLSASVAQEEELVARFKNENSALAEAMSSVNAALTRLHAPHPTSTPPLDVSDDLGNLLLEYTSNPSPMRAQIIAGLVDGLGMKPGGEDPDVRLFAGSTRQILAMLPQVNALVDKLQESRVSDEALQLQKSYLEAYGEFNARALSSRLLLGSIAVLLCGYVALLIYRLRRQTHRLTQQLDLENIVGDVKRQFEEHSDSLTVAVTESLAILNYFFDARRSVYASLNRETGRYDLTLGDIDLPGLEEFKEVFAERLECPRAKKLSADQPFLYENLQHGVQSHPSEASLSAGSLIATAVGSRHVHVLVLEHYEARRRPDQGEVRLLGLAAIALSRQISEFYERRERETLEARLDHAQRLEALGTLAGGIAHEFNNALGAILGYGEMALQLRKDTSMTRHYVEEMVSSGHRAKFIIDQILTFSRKKERVNKPFDVREAIDSILPMIRISVAGSADVAMLAEQGENIILGNPVELQQVLINLCQNAAHASEGDGAISISVRDETVDIRRELSHGHLLPGDYVMVSVMDNGCGIAASSYPHIFEPFFTTKAHMGGTGLGLAAVHGHVTAMNGKINIVSSVGNGTDFQIFFPLSGRRPVPLSEFYEGDKVPRGSGQTIMIAQENSALRYLLEEKVAALGYEPIGVSSTTALDEWLKSNQMPDLIILDLDLWPVLPNLTDVARAYAPAPTVFAGERQILTSLRLAQIVPVLKKPVNSLSLAATLSTQIRKQPKN